MAVVTVGLFHTGGHAELGGLQHLLARMTPGVRYERCFPARDRQRPRPGSAVASAPSAHDQGVTGEHLTRRMLQTIRDYHAPRGYSAYLLVDDADCRFCDVTEEERIRWESDLTRRVQEAAGWPIPFFALLAFQEVESWLLADWERSFGAEFEQAHELRAALSDGIPLSRWEEVERIGCPWDPIRGSCTRKLSAIIVEIMDLLPGTSASPRVRYSKATHGTAMLRRVEPDRIAAVCPQYRRDLSRLRAGIERLPR